MSKTCRPGWAAYRLKTLPMINRIGEYGLAGVLQLAATGQTTSEARDFDFEARKSLAEIQRGAVAFERWVESQDHFANRNAAWIGCGVFDAFDEACDGEVVGADAFERADATHEHVVEPFEHRGLFEGEQVLWLFNDEHESTIARCIAANGAQLAVGKVIAVLTLSNRFLDVDDGLSQIHRATLVVLQHVKREAFSTTATDAGQLGELGNQSIHGFGIRDS